MSEHYCTYKDGMCELDVDEAFEQGKIDGAKEFLAWYSGGKTMPSFGRYAKYNIDDVIAEWQEREQQ